MQIKLLVSAAAIALAAGVGSAAAGVGSAAADENFGTLDGISAFDSLAGIQAIPLDTDEMASITVAHYLKIDLKKDMLVKLKGHKSHYTHKADHGVKFPRGGGLVEDSDGAVWISSGARDLHQGCPPTAPPRAPSRRYDPGERILQEGFLWGAAALRFVANSSL